MILKDVATYLKDSATIANLVGVRVYPLRAPQDAGYPFITCDLIADVPPVYTLTGEPTISMASVQVDCWGLTIFTADRVAAAVRNRMSGYRGLMDTTSVRDCSMRRNNTLTEEPDGGTDKTIYRISMDFDLLYQVTVPDFT